MRYGRSTDLRTCPLPTPDDRLLFLLVDLPTYSLKVLQGRLFGIAPSQAQHWLRLA